MNAEKRKEIAAYLVGLGFKPTPGPLDSDGHGAVHSSTSDGIYFNLAADHAWDIQLIVVGPMMMTPIQYAEKVSENIIPMAPANYWAKSAFFWQTSTACRTALTQSM
jgi:hypothetical protein